MGTPATTTTSRPLESSSSTVARPEATSETSTVESVVPPIYMSSADTFSESTPNYSSISADQSYFCSAVSEDISSSIPTSATPVVDPASATTGSSSTADESAPSSEATSSEASSGESTSENASSEEASAEETSSEEVSSEEASTEGGDGATGEDAVCRADDGTSAESDHTTDANPPADTRRGNGDEETKGIEAVVTKLPRMAPIRTPWVGSPPPQAIQRRNEIIKRTGSPPELHHAQVRQAAEHVAQAARDAQRRMVWQLGNIARDTRISIEDMAKEVQKATGAAVAHINRAIETAIGDIGMIAEDESAHIQAQGVLTGEELERSRNDTNIQIMADLTQGSADIQALNAVSEGRFDSYLGQAEAKVFAIPDTGVVGRIPPPPAPPAPPSTRHFPVPAPDPIPQEGDRIADYQLISHAHEALASFVDTQSHLKAASYGHGANPSCANYFSIRANSQVDGMCQAKHGEMITSAQQAAEQMSNGSARAQFHMMLLGLTTPMSDYHERDRSGVVDANELAIRATMTETQYAAHQAMMTIYEKRDQAAEYLDRDLREDLTDNIYKMGRKAYKGLMEQAALAEVALESSAAPMAEGYRDLVARLDMLLPQGQFLDANNLVPKLIIARDNAESMRQQHVEMGEQQAANTIEQMQKVKKDQVEAITKAGNESADSVHNVVIQTGFDMALFGQQMTGSMSEQGIAGMSAAQGFAAHNAKAIMDSIHGTEGPGLTRIDQAVVGFFNGRIAGAEQGQFAGLAAFVQQMEDSTNGPLLPTIEATASNLETRATELDNKMPIRDMSTVAGLGGATLLCPLGGAIALGVYLYHTDADESAVMTQLGNLMWPGILGLEEVFNAQKPDTLRGRIRDRLNETEANQALRLFSESAADRGAARLEIARGSTAWFTGVNREARESVLQGMSSDERTLNADSVTSTRTFLEGELSGTQEELSLAYLDGNRDAAAAARTHEAMENARKEGTWGWIFSADDARERSDSARVEAMGRMDEVIRSELAVETAYLEPSVINAHHDAFFQSFASYVDPNHRSFTVEASREVVRSYATSSYNSAVLGFSPLGLLNPAMGLTAHIERIETGADARHYIDDVIDHGASSNEARDSRGVFEMNRAEHETSGILGTLGLSGISNTTQGRLTDAFEDRNLSDLERRLAAATTTEDRSRLTREVDEARTRHRARLQAMAVRLGAPANISPADAEAFMSQRMGAAFATTNTLSQAIGLSQSPSHARYGTEMIEHGRASLDAGVALASDGWGTNDDMLRRSYTDRTHAEIAGANARWSLEHGGEDMREMLGIRTTSATTPVGAGSWFSNLGAETSGDLAQELQVLALGTPENDADRLTIASLRYRQQRDAGTGFITDHSMSDTPEARYMDESHTRMARTILNVAAQHDPSLLARFGDNPNAIFNADGSLNSAVNAAAFENGNFRGNSSELRFAGDNVGYSADAFKAEVDRQEAMVMSGITTLALIVSLVLLVVPGVDIVAAGIITAILTGAATIVAKAGMRGGRYGWEEAATDVAQAAIEAAAAGVGGAISGGMGAVEEGVKLGRLASFGQRLVQRFGKFGGAIIREAMVGAASTAAQTALQDDIWNDGLGRGLQRVANGAIRGAAVSAATTAASEAVSHLMTRPRFDANGLERANPAQLMEKRMGTHATEVMLEGITNTAGTLVGEAVGVGIDYAQGNFHGTFGEALKQIGMAGLRELITSSIRSHITTNNRAHFDRLMDIAQRGGTLSDAELHALRAYGISAGVFHHGDDIEHVRGVVLEGRKNLNSPLLAQLPPNLREHVTHLDHESLGRVVSMLEKGGNPLSHPENLAFIHGLTAQIPGVSGETLAHEFGSIMASRRAGAASELDTAQRGQLREHLGAGMHEELRAALGDIAVDGMQHLSPEHLAQAAEMIASGRFNFDAADNLLRAAKAKNPDLDEFAFLHNLHAAVSTSRRAQDTMMHTALERHRNLVAMVPEEAAKIFATLGNMEVLTAQRLINSGSGGTPQERDALFHAALAKNPKLTREEFHGYMEAAATRVRDHVETERQVRRTQREERMTHVPEELRGTLSALPEAALVELRLRQMQGSLSPDDAVRLLNMAQRETPNVDLHALVAALHEAVKHAPTHVMSDAQSAEARQHLLSAIPVDQRGQIEHTPILILPADEFNALTRSQKGQAVTLIINGEPVVVLREGANPRALREEGIHALQARDKNWAAHIGSLDEHTMAQWDSLPLEQQIALYRNKLALEIDAQAQLIHSLESDIENAKTPAERRALQQHLEQVQRAHENLSRRQSEVGGLSDLDIHNMRAGFTDRPQWLEQPARLFAKDDDSTRPVRSAEEAVEAKKLTNEMLRSFDGDRRRNLMGVLEQMPMETLRALHAMPNELKNDSVLFNRIVLAGHQATDQVAFGAGLRAVGGAFSAKDLPVLAQHLQRLTTSDLGNAMVSISRLAGAVTDPANFHTLIANNLHTASQGVERLGILAQLASTGIGVNQLLGLNHAMHLPGGLDNARALGLPMLTRMLEITPSPTALHKLSELLVRSNHPTLLLDSVEHITNALGHAAVHDLIRLIARGHSTEVIISLGKLARLAPDDSNLPILITRGDSIHTSTKVSMAGGSSNRIFGSNLKELVDARINLVERVQDLQRHAQEAKDLASIAGEYASSARRAVNEAHELVQAYQQEARNFGEVAAREFAMERQLRSNGLPAEADAARTRALQAMEDGQRAHQEAQNVLRETERLAVEAQRRESEHRELVVRADEKVAIVDEAQKSLDRHRAAVTAIDDAQREINALRAERAPPMNVMPESEFVRRRNEAIYKAEQTIADNIKILDHETSAAQGLTERRRKSLRRGTPTDEIRNDILNSPPTQDKTTSGKPKDWVTGEELEANSSLTAIDHIYPVAEIFNEPGFSELPINDQIAILNMRENLAPLEVGRNGSKNDSDIASWLDGTAPLKPTLTPQQRIDAIARETRARDDVRAEIRRRVQAWRSR